MILTDQHIDLLLERLLPCNSKREYELTLAKFAEEMEWGEPDARGRRDGDPINRFFWGVATLSHEYTSCQPMRHGPLTYVEIMVIKWATTTQSQQAIRPDAEYLMRLLGRSLDEVKKAMIEYGPAAGRKGFGLTG